MTIEMKSAAEKPDIIKYAIMNYSELYRSYMPFITGGGLFLKSEHRYHLGDHVKVALILMSKENRFPVHGTVVWINPTGMGIAKPQGIGIQFDKKSEKVNAFIENEFAGSLNSSEPTYTM